MQNRSIRLMAFRVRRLLLLRLLFACIFKPIHMYTIAIFIDGSIKKYCSQHCMALYGTLRSYISEATP